MKCDKCGKESIYGYGGSGSTISDSEQTSIYEKYIDIKNGRFYYIKCRLLNKQTYNLL